MNNNNKKMFIGGNWKCNGTVKSVEKLVALLNDAGEFPANAEVVVAPTMLHCHYVVQNLRNDIAVSVQNTFTEAKAGAWTGELTPDVVADMGIKWTILGHSERRALLAESPDFVAKKTITALDNGLKVILCIGEQLEERQNEKTMEVCVSQLKPVFDLLKPEHLPNVVIAYEPVWAIGTGVTASPEQAQETHAQIRAWLREVVDDAEAIEAMRIIYGGSVKGSNCREIMKGADIDGFLVGGASLKAEFIEIIKSAEIKANL